MTVLHLDPRKYFGLIKTPIKFCPSLLMWIILTFTSLSPCFAQAKPLPFSDTVYPVSILWPSRVAFPTTPKGKGFVVDVSEDPQCSKSEFPEDHLILAVYADKRGLLPIAGMKFTSSYGFFDLSLVDVVGDGNEEFFLVTGSGHGTDVRSETLSVYRRVQNSFKCILRTPVSAYFGVDRWWYQPIFADVNGDGVTDLRLELHHDPYRRGSVDMPSLIPKTKVKEFVYDKAKGRMILYGSER